MNLQVDYESSSHNLNQEVSTKSLLERFEKSITQTTQNQYALYFKVWSINILYSSVKGTGT